MNRQIRMKKIGNMKPIGLLLFLLLAAGSLAAQDDTANVELTVSNSQVYEGERITLKIEVRSNRSRNVSRPDMPRIDGFRYLSSSPSTATSYSVVNGVSTMSYTFNWPLEATQEGVHQVPSISFAINGEMHTTQPVTLTVLDVDDKPDQDEIAERPDVFIEMEISDQRPVRGQQIIAELIIYFKDEMDLSSYQVAQGWVTEGFWQEDLNKHHSARAENVMLDGVRYRRAVLRRHALFPTRKGELELQPYRIQANVRYNTRGGNSYDFFRGSRSSTRNINLESEKVVINVQDLPDVPIGGISINAVGKLNVDRSLSDDQIKLGESVEIITEVSGSGNIALVSRPEYSFPFDFDVYRPQETVELDNGGDKVSGKKIFRDVIIARKVGRFEIPETRVARYNDERDRYETITLPALSLEVVRDPNAQIGFVSDGRFKVSPVTGVVKWSSGEQKAVYANWWFWIGLILPAIIFAGAYRVSFLREKLQNDGLFSRKQNALSKSEQTLKIARETMSQNDLKTPYTYIHQALADFITDSAGLPPSGHSDEDLAGFIQGNNAGENLAAEVQALLTKCSTIRFTPVSKEKNVIADIRFARNLIERLNKKL